MSRSRFVLASVFCGSLFLALFLLGWIISGVGRVAAQGRAPAQSGSIELRSDLVSFPVAVTLPDMRAQALLKKENFTVYEDGKRQEISHFSASDVPVDIVLAADTSGSMKGDIDLVKHAVLDFIDRMRPQDSGAVVSFARGIELLAGPTADRAALKGAVHEISAGSGTAYYDALYLICDEVLKNSGSPRKAVIVLSDGVDSSSYYDFERVSHLLERGGASSYFIEIDTEKFTVKGLRQERFTLSADQLERYRREYKPEESPLRYRNPLFFTPEETAKIAEGLYQIARREMRMVAEHTGGRVFPLKTMKDLPAIYRQISSELGTLYSIGYSPTNGKRDGTWRKLRVEVNVPGAETHTRSGYWAPAR